MKSQGRGDSGFRKAAWQAAPTSLMRKAAHGEVLRGILPFPCWVGEALGRLPCAVQQNT